MEDNFSIINWKNQTLYKESYDGNDHYVKYSKTNDTYQVWKGNEIVTDFSTKERAETESNRLNLLSSIEIANREQDEFEMPSQQYVTRYLESKGKQLHYLYSKPLKDWDEYDRSNFISMSRKLKEQDDFEDDEISVEIPGDEDNAPAGDKELNKKLSRQDITIKKYKEISAKMQLNLQNFKNATNNNDKEIAKNSLKQLTPEYQAIKKAYEDLKGINI